MIDLEGHAAKRFEEPLVVVDPVDPNRNVSASVSLSKMMAFVELARGYLAAPSAAFFEVRPDPPMEAGAFADALAGRGTALYALRFPTPNLIEDVVVPQLRKSLEGLVQLLGRHGFTVNRSDCEMGPDHCLLVFELLVDTLPAVARHQGPPLWNGENAAKFREKYAAPPGAGPFAGPFIEDGRYVVEVPRRFRTAAALLGSEEILGVSLGKNVRRSLVDRELLAGPDCWSARVRAVPRGLPRPGLAARPARARLEDAVAPLAGPDPDRVVERKDEDLAVPGLARAGGLADQVHDPFDGRVVDGHLDPDPRQQVDHVLGPAVLLPDPALLAAAPDLRDRHRAEPRPLERLRDRLEPTVPDDRHDHLHGGGVAPALLMHDHHAVRAVPKASTCVAVRRRTER